MSSPITFRQFYGVWFQIERERMSLSPAKFHKEVFDFLLDYDNWENDTGVLEVFRNGAKSTIVSLFITYLLVKDPSQTIIVQSADDRTATKVLKGVRDLIKRHPLATHLDQNEREQKVGSFYVNGSVDPQNASVVAYGIRSNVTGRRAHWIIYDDVEAKGNANSEDKREEIMDRISEGMNILHPKGKRLFVGTPHAYDTMYDKIIKSGASSLVIPMLRNAKGKWPNMIGDCVWPERFNDEEVAKKQSTVPEHAWMSQNMLIAWNMHDTLLDPNLLQTYRGSIDLHEANGERSLMLNGIKMLSCTAYWDISSGKHGRDDSVLAVVYTDAKGNYYVHKATALKGDIDQQCEQIKKIALELFLPSITVETNGVGTHAPHILRKCLDKTGIAVLEAHQSTNKAQRILEGFQVLLSGQKIFAHESVVNGPLRIQLRDFSFTSKGKDDYVDAVASALLREPIRINANRVGGGRNATWGNYGDAGGTVGKYDPFGKRTSQ